MPSGGRWSSGSRSASTEGWSGCRLRVFQRLLPDFWAGLTLASAKEERGRVYRIAEPTSL